MSPERAVTVVVPAYNSSDTIGRTLSSVVLQTLPPAAVVVVDDASTDNTADVARAFSDALPIEVITLKRNSGPAAARRAAIEANQLPLIALLDADDVWLPDHVANLAQVVVDDRAIASADALIWSPGHGVARRTYRDRHPIPPPARQLLELIRGNFVMIGSMFCRDAYVEAGGFRDGYTAAEDWDLWLRMVRRGCTIHAAEGPSFLYRLSSSGLTSRESTRTSYIRVLESAILEAESEQEREVARSALRREAARAHLSRAEASANAGEPRAARSAALKALRAPLREAAAAAALLVRPAMAARAAGLIRRWRGR